MNTLSAATALVPYREPQDTGSMQSLIDSVSSMSLADLLDALVLPSDGEEYASNLVGVVQHYSKKASLPMKEITAGVIETFRELKELNEDADAHGDEGLNLLKRIAKWGITRIVKYVFKLALKLMYKFARWVFKKILINGIKALVEWVVRPVLMSALEFIGFNPELWPFIAIAGGVAGLGYAGWKMFFSKSADDKTDAVSTVVDGSTQSLAATRAEAQKGIVPSAVGFVKELVSPAPTEVKPTVAAQGKAAVAAAPQPAGAPVEAFAPGADDKNIMAMIQRHEGIKYKPYKDSLGLWTIGVGHLIGDGKSLPPEWDREFSAAEVQNLFAGDYKKHKDAAQKIPGFDKLSISAQAALIDITYNMGPTWWHKWPSFTKYMQELDLKDAAASLEDSKWYTQVGSRAREDVALLGVGLSGAPGSTGKTTSVAGTTVKQTPGMTVASAQPAANDSSVSTGAGGGALPVTTSNTVDKNYIKGPNGSIVAVS
jgi:lysozyme